MAMLGTRTGEPPSRYGDVDRSIKKGTRFGRHRVGFHPASGSRSSVSPAISRLGASELRVISLYGLPIALFVFPRKEFHYLLDVAIIG